MTDLGLEPAVESFTSATSGYQFHLLVALSILIGFAIYPWAGRLTAIVGAGIAFLGVYCEVMEMLFQPNPFRLLIGKGRSQNVLSTIPSRGDHRQDLILIGHLDTNRTPLIFSSTRWVDFWRITTPIMFSSFCLEAALYLIGIFTGWLWIWPVTLFSALCAAMLAFMCAQAEFTPFSPGANDNATGAALVLALGEHLLAQPLQHTRVWLVNTGCEEVKHYGAIDFFERHHAEMVNPKTLVFEMLGRDGPAWLEREVLLPPFLYRADPTMIALAKEVATTHPEWAANPTTITGGHTEMADALRIGVPAITLIGIGKNGTGFGYTGPELYWHRRDDTPDKIRPEVLARNYAYTWAFIRRLDVPTLADTASQSDEGSTTK
jgi:hypothetical protein